MYSLVILSFTYSGPLLPVQDTGYEVEVETTFDQFTAHIASDPRSHSLDRGNMKLTFASVRTLSFFFPAPGSLLHSPLSLFLVCPFSLLLSLPTLIFLSCPPSPLASLLSTYVCCPFSISISFFPLFSLSSHLFFPFFPYLFSFFFSTCLLIFFSFFLHLSHFASCLLSL